METIFNPVISQREWASSSSRKSCAVGIRLGSTTKEEFGSLLSRWYFIDDLFHSNGFQIHLLPIVAFQKLRCTGEGLSVYKLTL
ncbi:hypothetical protein SOMG_03160 [Schizosaccharomyces osmophilus]|uniref:Uncharacterized protein n=1 Tax=Schizosaccharomyces osmophilus TaxID=2545709 RepID=A0AAE9WEZ2_9SCHI|nr:uncharacterized protein SOMG_03160 [Schizosaccharomyces osmophilus]WBW74409.1 hypothetical protein SOMG_03160 [Schizosaccharomyces osmophilus]